MLGQPSFLNTVVQGYTNLPAPHLVQICLRIEHENGRKRTRKRTARTLDIDVIFYGKQIIRLPGLTIPHPRFSERKFVLVPLAEIAPTFKDPQSGLTVTELLRRSTDSAMVQRV